MLRGSYWSESAVLVTQRWGRSSVRATSPPAAFELGDDVNEVVTRRNIEFPVGLHQPVDASETLRPLSTSPAPPPYVDVFLPEDIPRRTE